MGQNKLLMEYNGAPLFSYSVALSHLFQKSVVVTKYGEISSYCYDREIFVVQNDESDQGISASIKLGVANCGGVDGFMFFPCDQPRITEKTVTNLLDHFYKMDKIIVPKVGEKCFSPCIFPKRYKNTLLALEGDTGGRKIYMKNMNDCRFIYFDSDGEFLDIDTQEDIKKDF